MSSPTESIVVVLGFAYLCFTVLAPWQLGKNTTTSRENGQISDSLSADPVPVTTSSCRARIRRHQTPWRRVTATGTYHPEAQVLARLRVVDGDRRSRCSFRSPSTAARPCWSTAATCGLAGLERARDGPPPTGTVTITARLRDSEPVHAGKEPFRQNGAQQVYSINTAPDRRADRGAAGRLLPATRRRSARRTRRDRLPHLDAGPFLSYGIQWIAFGIIAPIGVGYFVSPRCGNADGRRRNRRATTPAPPLTTEQKLADRYGRRR